MAVQAKTIAKPGGVRRLASRSAKPMTQREITREQRLDRIRHAAWLCFTRRGFHGTSMHDIAKEAGISVGHLYNFFESKEQIVESFAQSELKRIEERNRTYEQSGLSEEEICRKAVYELALTRLDKMNARVAFEIISESVVNERIRRVVEAYDKMWHDVLLPCYKEVGGFTDEEAKLRLDADLALVDGLNFRVMANEAIDKEGLAHKVAERIWRSLSGDSAY